MTLPRAPLLCAQPDDVRPVPSGEPVDAKSWLSRTAPALVRFATPPSVLILTRRWDPEADLVGSELFARGINYVRLNAEDVAESFRFTCIDGVVRFSVQGESVAAAGIGVVLLRHFRTEHLAAPNPERDFAETFANEQWQAAFAILRDALSCIWINDAEATTAALDRARQLQVAAACGFRTPRTLITNDVAEVQAFAEAVRGPLIVKALRHHGVEHGGMRYSMYCRDLPAQDDPLLESLASAPCVIQEKLDRVSELRVTVIGETMFAVELSTQAMEAQLDIHRTPLEEVGKSVIRLPADFERRCREMAAKLRLTYAALDFVLDAEKEATFLEVNPDADWCWLEPQTELPISAAMADHIQRFCAKRPGATHS